MALCQDKFWSHCTQEWQDKDITADNIRTVANESAESYIAPIAELCF